MAVFITAVTPAWSIQNADAIVLTINAVGVLIGSVIGVSTVCYTKEKAQKPNL